MTNFNTQVGGGVYRIQMVTNNKEAYELMQEIIRGFVDLEEAQKVVVSKNENTTHIELFSACNCEALGMEVHNDD